MLNCLSSLVRYASVYTALIYVVSAATTSLSARASTCTPVAGGSGSIDDAPAIHEALKACPSGTIIIPTGTTYYINSAVTFAGCSGCTFQVDGTLKVSNNLDYWHNQKAVFWMDGIQGATVLSTTGKGLFDGNGQKAYDEFATNKTLKRASLFYINNSHNIALKNLQFQNAPSVFHDVKGGSSNVNYDTITLRAASKSSNPPKNTDGWAVGASSFVTITNSDVTNTDDCVGFKPGCNYVTVKDIICRGSHGLSVGSLGKGPGSTDTVKNVWVDGADMRDGTKGVGIKYYPGGEAHGSPVSTNVTFQNVAVSNIDYAVHIQSCYGEEDDYCEQYPSTGRISGVIVKNISGTTSAKYAPSVASINCPKAGTCGITMTGMTIQAPSGSTKYLCSNTPSNLGVICSGPAKG